MPRCRYHPPNPRLSYLPSDNPIPTRKDAYFLQSSNVSLSSPVTRCVHFLICPWTQYTEVEGKRCRERLRKAGNAADRTDAGMGELPGGGEVLWTLAHDALALRNFGGD